MRQAVVAAKCFGGIISTSTVCKSRHAVGLACGDPVTLCSTVSHAIDVGIFCRPVNRHPDQLLHA
jgi:hypothetical protein